MAGTYTNLLYHLVFSTKHRRALIHEALEDELYRYIGGIIRGEGGKLLEIGGMPDHVHLLVKLRPYPSISDMLKNIKANSSKWVNEEGKISRRFGWQDGYAAFTVSESQVPHVTRYVQTQRAHHQRSDFKRELVALLDRHGVEYDERYLWD